MAVSENTFDSFLPRARRIGVDPRDEDVEKANARTVSPSEHRVRIAPAKLVGSYAQARHAMRQMVAVEPIGAAGRVAILSTMLQRAYERQCRIRQYSGSS